MKPEDLLLADVLDFRPDKGTIRLQEQRVVILSATAMGLLRKELIDSLGVDTARRLLLRFGYADGYHDAVNLRDRSSWADPVEGLRAGATLHALEGIVRTENLRLQLDAASGAFTGELEWHDSYEAEQHVFQYGTGPDPVCWTLVGYASGYASACLGREVFFAESSCVGQGAPHCTLVGMDAARWGEKLAALRHDFGGLDLGKEVERRRADVHRQMRELARRERRLARREREVDALRERLSKAAAARQFVAQSPAMLEVLEMASRVAPLDTTVLVCGESGTGKEFVVRTIHEQSARADRPLVSVNCAALPESLLESELFGHVRGAFTGAVRDKTGLFELATAGTLFLDEVGELAPTIQAKLLRALQEGEIRKVGGERAIRVSPRVIAATNRDLKAAVARGSFREDLYFPPRRLRDPGSAAARAPRGDPGAHRPVPARRRAPDEEGRAGRVGRGHDAPDAASLARERAGAGAHDPARRDPGAWTHRERPRAASRAALEARGRPSRRHPRPGEARAECDRAGAAPLPGQSPARGESPQHQHRDPVAAHEALRARGIGSRRLGLSFRLK